MANARSYVEVTKPRIVLLLVFTSFAAMFVASRFTLVPISIETGTLALVTITAGCAGCNAVTCYVDRDIDLMMVRTQERPLPSGKIDPPSRALYFGLLLILASLVLAGLRNLLSFASIAAGAFDNVVVYSLILKRKSPLNILLGGISGGLPVIFGWAYVTGSVNATAILMAVLVILWTPNHIWSLALKFKEDYERANVPMLPVITQEKRAIRLIVLTSFLLFVFSMALFFLNTFGPVYLIAAGLLGAIISLLNIWLFIKPTKQTAWIVFKFSSPYLALIFLAMMVDVLLF